MDNIKLLAIVGIVITFICAFSLGLGWNKSDNIKMNDFTNSPSKDAYISQVLEKMPEGAIVEINIEQEQTPEKEFKKGETIDANSDKWINRTFSWFGLGAGEVAAQDQGLSMTDGGKSADIGLSKGYGILERFWNWIKSLFWGLSFVGLALVVMLFIPATSVIASTILRFLASLIPVLGSAVEKIIASFSIKKPLVQTIAGGQKFKDDLNKDTILDLTDKQKEGIVNLFTNAMATSQDTSSQSVVKTIKQTLL